MVRLRMICLMWCTVLSGVIACWDSPCRGAQEVDGLAEDPDFKPLVEAKMPAGFPGHTPVGTVEIKKYPAYRKAQAFHHSQTGRSRRTPAAHREAIVATITSARTRPSEKNTGYGAEVSPWRCTVCQPAACRA